jgi:16S rRNA (cytosine967-C5)-methyltransferase
MSSSDQPPRASGARSSGTRSSGARPKASPRHDAPLPDTPGHAARRLAVFAYAAVTERGQVFDEAFSETAAREPFNALETRDRSFARLIAATAIRRQGELETVVRGFIERPLPNDTGRLMPILVTAAAQLLCLGTPAHAAISQAVDLTRGDKFAHRFDRLANALLRRVATEGPAIMANLDGVRLNTPDWLWTRWVAAYGETEARLLAAANLTEAALDIAVKSDPEAWAATLSGVVLPTGAVRVREAGRVEALPGYSEGQWWVQDAAAQLPVRLLGDVSGQVVADLCAAPGGKTAQLAAGGAHVTAIDQSGRRLRRLRENLARLQLEATVIEADVRTCAAAVDAPQFDAVLLDAPCTATGTIRRHPDILRARTEDDVTRLSDIQRELLASAASLVRPGGTLVYCTCSLEPEEGEQVIAAFLRADPQFSIKPILADELGVQPCSISPEGYLRTLPHHALSADGTLVGLDGFFAARLVRQS